MSTLNFFLRNNENKGMKFICKYFLISIFVGSIFSANATVIKDNKALTEYMQMHSFEQQNNNERYKELHALFTNKDYEKVIDGAQKLIKYNNQDWFAYEYIGTSYYLLKRPDKAKSAFITALKINSESITTLFYLGVILMELNEVVEAEKSLIKAIALDSGYVQAHLALGLLYEYKRLNSLAEVFLNNAVRLEPNNIEIASDLARVLNKNKKYEKTVTLLEPLTPISSQNQQAHILLAIAYYFDSDYQNSLNRYKQIGKLKTNSPESMLGQSMAYRGLLEYDKALNVIQTLITNIDDMGDAYIEQGLVYLGLKKNAEANKSFEKAIELGANKLNISNYIAKFYINIRELDKAKSTLEKTIKQGISNENTYARLSEVYLAHNKVNEGELTLLAGLKAYPDSTYLYFRLTSFLASIGKYEQALDYAKKGLVNEPNSVLLIRLAILLSARLDQPAQAENYAKSLYEVSLKNNQTTMLYASYAEKNNSIDLAISLYKRVLKTSGNNPLALNNLSGLLLLKGDLEQSEAYALKANQIVTENANIMDTLAWVWHKQGKNKKSSELFQKASEVAPELGVIWYHWGIVLAELNMSSESKASLEKSLSFNKGEDWGKHAEQLLAQ